MLDDCGIYANRYANADSRTRTSATRGGCEETISRGFMHIGEQ